MIVAKILVRTSRATVVNKVFNMVYESESFDNFRVEANIVRIFSMEEEDEEDTFDAENNFFAQSECETVDKMVLVENQGEKKIVNMGSRKINNVSR